MSCKVSRQRKWQLIKEASCLCISCGKGAKRKGTYRNYCEVCAEKQKTYRHNRYLKSIESSALLC